MPESITVSAMFFLPYVAIITAAAFKKDCSYINKFVCSVIPDLDLRILQMLIRKCFRDALQRAVY